MKKILVMMLILAAGVSCFADDAETEPKSKKVTEELGWFISPGIVYASHNDEEYLLGTEISIFNAAKNFNNLDIFFYGAFMDVLYDSQLDGFKYTFGPELGITPFGIDGGLTILESGGKTDFGYSVRAFFTLPPVGCCQGFGPPFILYYRYNRIQDVENYHEVGIQWKLPIPLANKNKKDKTLIQI